MKQHKRYKVVLLAVNNGKFNVIVRFDTGFYFIGVYTRDKLQLDQQWFMSYYEAEERLFDNIF